MRTIFILSFCILSCAQALAYDWEPNRQFNYAQNQCRGARAAIDKDECQYLTEKLEEALTDCINEGSPYARECARLLPRARQMHARANHDPVLRQHRQNQWDSQREYQEQELRRGPSGIMNYPNYNRNCVPMQNGQYSCY